MDKDCTPEIAQQDRHHFFLLLFKIIFINLNRIRIVQRYSIVKDKALV